MEKLRSKKHLVLLITDIVLITLSYIIAYIFCTDDSVWTRGIADNHIILMTITFIYIIVLYVFSLYKSLWTYASTTEFVRAVTGCSTGGMLSFAYNLYQGTPIHYKVIVLGGIFSVITVVGFRVSFRIVRRLKLDLANVGQKGFNNVMVIGAGYAGKAIINEMRLHSEMKYKPVVIIDDDHAKAGRKMSGIQIFGNRDKITEAVQKYEVSVIVIAIPSMSNKCKEELINLCKTTKCKLKLVPSVYDLLDRRAPLRKLRDVEVEDLLGRDQVQLDNDGIAEYLQDKTVLVTGGGGSIGSELSRQIALFKPARLILLDIYENNVYDLENELKIKFPELNQTVVIASVRDKLRMDRVFDKYKPDVVFHAAAHKHVPLMEHNPFEAIKNNVFGTLNTVEVANKYGVERFVLISSDKAVNPTNVMGATKRICEMIIQAFDKLSQTEYVAVRFGNVLGSNGSVIPLFKKQIAAGGPVTLTHRDITRYFMTIPEAAQLVLQAGAYAQGGEIFVLDMGKPVKIYDLANDLIMLSGLDPNIDIEIKCTGLRPGEKLYEEVLMNEEGMTGTRHEKIFIGKPLEIDYMTLRKELSDIEKIIDRGSRQLLLGMMMKLVPTFQAQDENALSIADQDYDSVQEEEKEEYEYEFENERKHVI